MQVTSYYLLYNLQVKWIKLNYNYDLLFNAYICDLFFDIDDLDFAIFAYHNTPYSCLSDMRSVFGQLKGDINKIFDWFKKKFLREMLKSVT